MIDLGLGLRLGQSTQGADFVEESDADTDEDETADKFDLRCVCAFLFGQSQFRDNDTHRSIGTTPNSIDRWFINNGSRSESDSEGDDDVAWTLRRVKSMPHKKLGTM